MSVSWNIPLREKGRLISVRDVTEGDLSEGSEIKDNMCWLLFALFNSTISTVGMFRTWVSSLFIVKGCPHLLLWAGLRAKCEK
jgi:hypothetical protein